MQNARCRQNECSFWGWPPRCLASVALCALAACSSDRIELTPESETNTLSPGPDTVPPVTPYGGEDPDPAATETNFFSIGCDEDSDCSVDRRCKLPSADASVPKLQIARDAGVPSDAGLGADAESYPPGLCVLRVVD